MRNKLLKIVLCIIFIITITGCINRGEISIRPITNYTIEDTSKNIKDFVCAQALEEIYKDENYIYYLSCIKSNYIVVKYEDGEEENIVSALKRGEVNISDLDKFNIKYIKESIEVENSINEFELFFYQKTMITPNQKEVIIKSGEIKEIDYNVYAYEGHIGVKFGKEESYTSLREALLQNKITMDEILDKAKKDIKDVIMYKDGGSVEYRYPDYTIIKFNSLNGNRDVYFGSREININNIK